MKSWDKKENLKRQGVKSYLFFFPPVSGLLEEE